MTATDTTPAATDRSQRVGWIGLGRIGRPMVERVLAAGWPLVLWARPASGTSSSAATAEAVSSMLARGATLAESLGDLAQRCDIVCTVVTGPEDVQGLHAALMPNARAGTLFIDLSTATPAAARAAATLAHRHGLAALDAPVSGGVAGAVRATLTTFVGGDAPALERARPLLASFAQRIVPCGAAGNGYRMKLVNQTLMVGVLMGLADGARLARAAGFEEAMLKPALSGGTGASVLLENYLPRMLSGDGPVTFTLALLLKDLRLARAEAHELRLDAPLLDAAIVAVKTAIERHGADAGMQALAR